MAHLCTQMFGSSQPVIGMLHCPPLPGAPRHRPSQSMRDIIDFVLRDAQTLVAGKVHGLMLENFGDTPFYPVRVPAHTTAALTAIACEVRRNFDLPLGINMLRNDGCGALAVARAAGARFIRVNVLCGARVTDQGILQGIAHKLLREPGAGEVAIFADVDVKHSAAVAPIPIDQEVHDLIERGGASAVIVSGSGTGKATDLAKAQRVKQAAKLYNDTPVFIGSGITAANIAEYRTCCDGFIVGSSLKQSSVDTPIDPARVAELMRQI